jgi:hypothetical protein
MRRDAETNRLDRDEISKSRSRAADESEEQVRMLDGLVTPEHLESLKEVAVETRKEAVLAAANVGPFAWDSGELYSSGKDPGRFDEGYTTPNLYVPLSDREKAEREEAEAVAWAAVSADEKRIFNDDLGPSGKGDVARRWGKDLGIFLAGQTGPRHTDEERDAAKTTFTPKARRGYEEPDEWTGAGQQLLYQGIMHPNTSAVHDENDLEEFMMPHHERDNYSMLQARQEMEESSDEGQENESKVSWFDNTQEDAPNRGTKVNDGMGPGPGFSKDSDPRASLEVDQGNPVTDVSGASLSWQ